MNTKITYSYRDASNYKTFRTVVVQGVIEWKQIKKYLDCGEYFIPYDVSLPELQSELRAFPNEDDHVWHELHMAGLEWTLAVEPTEEFHAEELLKKFKYAHKHGWKEKAAEKRLGVGMTPLSIGAKQIQCPKCGALPGEDCKTPGGRRAATHGWRIGRLMAKYAEKVQESKIEGKTFAELFDKWENWVTRTGDFL